MPIFSRMKSVEKSNDKILLIDNNVNRKSWGSNDLRRALRPLTQSSIHIFRGPQNDFPENIHPYSKIILSGSLTSILENASWIDRQGLLISKAIEFKIPILGVCFGHQLIAKTLFGATSVGVADKPEFGWTEIKRKNDSVLFQDLPKTFYSFNSHFDRVISVNSPFQITADSTLCSIQSFESRDLNVYGIQFHPERILDEAKEIWDESNKKRKAIDFQNYENGPKLYNIEVGNSIFRNFLSI